MTGSVTIIPEDSQFQIELGNAENKLVVVDFTASWCGPCQRIAPFFAEMAIKYPRAVFLKVDVDQCPETASSQGVTAMPTFIFYRSRVKIGQVTGADQSALEAKIQHFLEGDDGSDGDSGVQGHLDLVSFLNKSGCECLNESLDHPLANCLQSSGGFLESDCDEQLIISLDFNQPVKLHSLKIKAPTGNGPKNMKLFINHPRTLGFDEADSMEPAQMIELQAGDLDGNVVPLRFVKFQNVHNFQLFIKDNQDGSETTQIDHLCIVGSPINSTKMDEFKRGKREKAIEGWMQNGAVTGFRFPLLALW